MGKSMKSPNQTSELCDPERCAMHELKAHSIYLTGGDFRELPEKISANLASFKSCYSDFEHQLYTDDSLREFIRENYEPDVLWAYDELIPLAYKADLGRYCLLYKLGGVYADLSVVFFQRIWLDQFPDRKIILFRDGFSHAPWIVSNSILIARPGLLIFKYLIDKIVDHVRSHFYGFNPLCPTGPNLLGRAAAQLLEMEDFSTGEVVRINKNPSTWSYSYLVPGGEVLAVNVKIGNGLLSLGHENSDNYNEHWNNRRIYKNEPLGVAVSHLDVSSHHSAHESNTTNLLLWQSQELQKSIEVLRQQLASAESQTSSAEAEIAQLKEQLKSQLASFHRSKSWRVTAPLRWFFALFKTVHAHETPSSTEQGLPENQLAQTQDDVKISIEEDVPLTEQIAVSEQAPITSQTEYDFGSIDSAYTQTMEMVDGERYEVLFIDGMKVYFHAQAFSDVRGIGRHARELISELRKKSSSRSQADKDVPQAIYFFSTIHWCPEILPENSVVLIHDIIPVIFPEIFPELSAEIKGRCEGVFRSAQKIMTISHSSRDDILKYLNVEAEKIKVIPNGITRFDAEVKPTVFIPESDYFVFVGTADPHKNLDVVLEALKKNHDLKLVLIGHEASFQNWMAKHADIPSQSIYLAGRLSDAEAAYVIKRAIAMVFPSLYEGFGLPPLEAALLGVPSICSERAAMTETLSGAAVFADPHDPVQWLEAMNALRSNHAMRHGVALAAKNKAKAYSWDDSANQFIESFRELSHG